MLHHASVILWADGVSVMRRLLATPLAAVALIAAAAPVLAQTSASAHTYGTRYDLMGRVVGTLAPDPDGTGALKYAAVRNTYNSAGRLTKVETGELANWKSQTIAPASWGTDFTVLSSVETLYDASGRKTRETSKGAAASGNPVSAIVQYSYDSTGELECTAVRMNLAAALPASACTLSAEPTSGSNGPDRITRNRYDLAGQLVRVEKAYGTPLLQYEATYTYSGNGKRTSLIDARGYG